MGAKGTVGGALTAQKRGGDTILRSTPVPTDPYSLAQAYQRWIYKDYAYLWTLLLEATKQTYRTRASKYHITGFSLWMREHLRDLPDILAWWRLDDNLGATTIDSSKNENDASIFGASPATGLIDHCLEFDGLNDYLQVSNITNIHIGTGDFTLQFFLCPIVLNGDHRIILCDSTPSNIQIYFNPPAPANTTSLMVALGGVFVNPGTKLWTLNSWYSIALRRISGTLTWWFDGILFKTLPHAGNAVPSTTLQFAYRQFTGHHPFNCRMDNIIFYDWGIPQTLIERWALRRYSL